MTGLRRLGLPGGGILMVHTRMSALGWVIGGPQTVVESLLEAVGPDGTLIAYVSWSGAYHIDEWPEEWQRAYRDEYPPFDPVVSESAIQMVGRIPEWIRTWPGARRSLQPEASIAAVGARADWLTADHPLDDAYGPGSPLAKLVEAEGRVLLLGAPLDTITLLHHAEAIADVPNKGRVTYRLPVREGGGVVWREFHDIDTSGRAFPYAKVVPEGIDPFEVIARAALDAGAGRSGRIAGAECHLFEAAQLVRFAVGWMEERFKFGA